MQLVKAEINNFRSIEAIQISFDPRCRTLVGINESGKTNILRALSLLDPATTSSADDLRELPIEDSDAVYEIYFRFVLSPLERKIFQKYLSERALVVDKTSRVEATTWNELLTIEPFLRVDIHPHRRYFASAFFPGDREEEAPGWFKPSPSCAPEQVFELEGKKHFARDVRLVQDPALAASPPAHLVPATVGDVEKLLDDACKSFEKSIPECIFWRYSDAHLLPGSVDLDAFAANPDSCLPLKYMFRIAGISDIPETIKAKQTRPQGIRNLFKKVSEATTKHLHAVWKDHRDISFVLLPNGNRVEPLIQDSHNAYEMGRRSDGFKRFATFLLMVSSRVKADDLKNVLFLQDEPDTGLHPAGARFLRDELIKISTDNLVVFSTHSIFMIDRERVDRHLLVSKAKEITTVEDADLSNITDEEVVYRALGYSLFETLKQKNLVFEGWSDKQVFAVFVDGTKKTDEIREFEAFGRCHVKGVKEVPRLTPMLELANRNWWVVSDSDEAAKQGQRQYDGKGKWYRYDELCVPFKPVTVEDFISPAAIVAAAKKAALSHPALGTLTTAEVGDTAGRLSRIGAFLHKSGCTADESKEALKAIKGVIFEDLRPAHIEKSYEDFARTLLKKVKEDAA